MNGDASRKRLLFVTAVGVSLAAVAGVALGGFGLLMGVVVPAVTILLAMAVSPVVGVVAMAALVPIERLVFLEGVGTAVKLLAALVAVMWLFLKLRRGESLGALLRDPVLVAAMIFITYTFLSVLWSVVPVNGGIGQFARPLMMLGLFVLVMDLVRSWREAEWVIRAAVLGSTAAAAITLHQFLSGGVRRAGEAATGGINSTAVVLVMALPLAFFLLRSRQPVFWRIVGLASVGLSILGIAVTFSRMSFLLIPMIIAAECWDAVRSRRGRGALIALGVVGVILVVRFVPIDKVVERIDSIGPYVEATLGGHSSTDATTSGRGFHIRVALAIFRDNPVFGAGLGAYGPLFLRYQRTVPGLEFYYQSERSAHGTIWDALANYGVVGIVLLGIFFWNIARSAWRAGRNARTFGLGSNRALMVRATSIALLTALAYSFYDDMHIAKLPWMLAGLSVALLSLTRRDLRVAGAKGVRTAPDGLAARIRARRQVPGRASPEPRTVRVARPAARP